ncbi:hypothetical protein AVEN_178590-1, partial [Araneus ventricosus]
IIDIQNFPWWGKDVEFFSSAKELYITDFFQHGRTITKEEYVKVLKCQHDSARPKRLDLWKVKLWVQVHQDNALVHRSLMMSKRHIPILPQPAYFPNIAPCDFPCIKKFDDDSQVPKKCSDEGTGGCGERRFVIHLYISKAKQRGSICTQSSVIK